MLWFAASLVLVQCEVGGLLRIPETMEILIDSFWIHGCIGMIQIMNPCRYMIHYISAYVNY